MEYHLVIGNSNHSRCSNMNIIIITIKFHQLMSCCRCLVKFSLSGRDGDSYRFQPARELFQTQTQTYLCQGSLRSPLVQLRYSHGSEQRRTLRDTKSLPGSLGPAYPWTHATGSPHIILPSMCVVSLTRSRPELSYLAS